MSQSKTPRPLRAWVPLDRIGSAKVGPKGQIVIPKAMRDRAGMQPGGTVLLRQDEGGTIALAFGWNSVDEAFDYFARFPVQPGMEGKSALDILHEMDAEDEAILERKYGTWPKPSMSSTLTPSSRSSSTIRTGNAPATRSRRQRAVRSPSD
jgi:AbrB family looped-hinge helix DNA binding protein